MWCNYVNFDAHSVCGFVSNTLELLCVMEITKQGSTMVLQDTRWYVWDHFHSLKRVDLWCFISSVVDWTSLDIPSEFFGDNSGSEHVWFHWKAIIPCYRGTIYSFVNWNKPLLLRIKGQSVVSLAINTARYCLTPNIASFQFEVRLQGVINVNCKIFCPHNAWIFATELTVVQQSQNVWHPMETHDLHQTFKERTQFVLIMKQLS